ncbi:glutathione S-transferase family protein, partial [Acinetobacter baumannii]
RGMLGWIDYDATMDIVSRAVGKGPYLFGERFTAADVVIGSGVIWGLMFGTFPKRPEFAAYAERLKARPAYQRYQAKDAS